MGVNLLESAAQIYKPSGKEFGYTLSLWPVITERERAMVRMAGNGRTNREIGQSLGGLATSTIKNCFVELSAKLGGVNRTNTVFLAIQSGQVEIEEMVPENFDFSRFDDLHPFSLEVLDAFLEGNGSFTNQEIANRVDASEGKVKNHLVDVYAALGTTDQTSAMVYFLGYKRSQGSIEPGRGERVLDKSTGTIALFNTQILTDTDLLLLRLAGKGLSRREIAETIGYAVSTVISRGVELHQKLGVHDDLAALLVALERGDIKLAELLPEDAQLATFSGFSTPEIAILRTMAHKGEYDTFATSSEQIAKRLEISESSVKKYIHKMYAKLNIDCRLQLVVLYLAFAQGEKRLRAEYSMQEPSLFTDSELRMLRLAGAGYDNGEIAQKINYSKNQVRHKFPSLYSRLNLKNRTHAILFALEKGYITIEEMIPDDFEVFEEIPEVLLKVLQQYVEEKGVTNSEISRSQGLGIQTVKNYFSIARDILGAPSNASLAVRFLAYQRQRTKQVSAAVPLSG